ncbi:MAG: hypothetical protein ABIP91_00210 [Sphingomicrobium sp.]
MLELLFLAAAGQLQTIRLPPPVAEVPPAPSAPVRQAVPTPVELALPDLTITGIRVINEQIADFEVRNQGSAATAAPVRIRACVYLGRGLNGVYTIRCSPDLSAGVLAAGQSKWVKVDCFLDDGGVTPTGGGGGIFGSPGGFKARKPQCADLTFGAEKIAKYDAFADPAPRVRYSEGPAAPAAVQPDCGDEFGCVRETNERNNRREFPAPSAK